MKSFARPSPLSFLAQGGWILLIAFVLVRAHVPAPPHTWLAPFGLVVFAAGLLLAWRFHSSRAFFALLVIFLAERSLSFFSLAHGASARHAIELLLAINFVLLALVEEAAFALPSMLPFLALLLAQAIGVVTYGHIASSTKATIPPFVAVIFLGASIVLLVRWILVTQPLEGAFFWSMAACYLAMQAGTANSSGLFYFAVAGLILCVALVETGYRLAFHDELTGLPLRRAFNDALRQLEAPYTIAAVDIDHFKRVNDTYGHDTGDEVLRLVASRLARVGIGGTAYRCGGEEFNIVFPGKLAAEVLEELERLRLRIEQSPFRLRSADRRKRRREASSDRRTKNRRGNGRAIRKLANPRPDALAVTVSIGVATARKDQDAEAVLRSADHALYRAKEGGRNRIETASSFDRRAAKAAASVA